MGGVLLYLVGIGLLLCIGCWYCVEYVCEKCFVILCGFWL